MKPTCQQGTVQSGEASLVVWGVCNRCDMGFLKQLEVTLTIDMYETILQGNFHSFMSSVHSENFGQFQKNRVRPHMPKVVADCVLKHSSDFGNIHWPPKSPDMRIIRYVWNALQHALCSGNISLQSHFYGFVDCISCLQDNFRYKLGSCQVLSGISASFVILT
ncbi:DDE_3 domain-containing protein [Trichonephila clavipes]|nr:DDE_3 domain-containing protein [Trichonephila clavipes]